MLVVASAASPLEDIGAISSGNTAYIQTLAANLGFEIVIAANRNPLPLLIGAAITGPLVDICAVGCRVIVDIQALATVLADKVVITAANVNELPFLPGIAIASPLSNIGAIRCVWILHIHTLATVPGNQLIIGC